MELEKLNCPNCGGPIRVTSNRTPFNCEHCGSALVVREETGVYLLELQDKITSIIEGGNQQIISVIQKTNKETLDTRLYQSQIEQELSALSIQLVSFKSEFSALAAAKKDANDVRRFRTISIQIYMLTERTRLLKAKLHEIKDDKKSLLDHLYEQYTYVEAELEYLSCAGDSPDIRQFKKNLSTEYNDFEDRMMKIINASLKSSSLVYPLENDAQILSDKLMIIQDDIDMVSALQTTSATQKILMQLQEKEKELNNLISKIQSETRRADLQRQKKAKLADLQRKKDEILERRKLTFWESVSLSFRVQTIRTPDLPILGALFLFFCFSLIAIADSNLSSITSTTSQDIAVLQTEAFETAVASINKTATALVYKAIPTITPTLAATATPPPIEGVIIQDMSNVRSSPDLTAPVLRVLKLNSRVTALANSPDGNWNLVYTESNEKGWIFKQLIKFTGSPEMLPVSTEIFPTPVPTIPPTVTLIPAISLHTIYANLQTDTTLQFQQYTQSIVGKPVRETVQIGNVDERGRVILHGPWSPELFNVSELCVIVTGWPSEKAAKLSAGQKYSLKAIINGIIGGYNYFNNCENTLILNFVE